MSMRLSERVRVHGLNHLADEVAAQETRLRDLETVSEELLVYLRTRWLATGEYITEGAKLGVDTSIYEDHTFKAAVNDLAIMLGGKT